MSFTLFQLCHTASISIRRECLTHLTLPVFLHSTGSQALIPPPQIQIQLSTLSNTPTVPNSNTRVRLPRSAHPCFTSHNLLRVELYELSELSELVNSEDGRPTHRLSSFEVYPQTQRSPFLPLYPILLFQQSITVHIILTHLPYEVSFR